MAIPFALPLQSPITDENKLAASENVPDSLGDIALAGDNIEFKPETEPNYSVVGTPTIEDNIVSGFNSSSCLTTENPFIAEECTGIEIVLVFEVPAVVGVPMIANAVPGVAPYFRVIMGSSGSLAIRYTDTLGEEKIASTRAFITANTKNWYKAIYDASAGTWTHYNSTDEGVTWTQLNRVGNYSNAPSLETGNLLYWGKNGENQGVTYFNGKIYLEDCYIKTTSISGEKTLKFFKETGKTTVSATVPEVDLTGYLQNVATGTGSLVVAGEVTDKAYATAIGFGSKALQPYTLAAGYNSTVNSRCSTAIGNQAGIYSSNGANAIGFGAQVQGAEAAIQIGYGRNTTPHTLAVGLGDWTASLKPTTEEEGEYILLQADGKIPAARLPDVSYKSLDETQKTQLLLNGTYNGSEVIDGEVFTEYDGKFVEFDKTPRAFDNLQNVLAQANVRTSTYFKGKYILAAASFATLFVSDDEGTTWSTYDNPIGAVRYPYIYNLGDKVIVRGDASGSSTWTTYYISETGFDNWTYVSDNTIKGLNSFQKVNGLYYAKGTDASGNNRIYSSTNGLSWTEVESLSSIISGYGFSLASDENFLYIGRGGLYRYNGTTLEGPYDSNGYSDVYVIGSKIIIYSGTTYYITESLDSEWEGPYTAPNRYLFQQLGYTNGVFLGVDPSSQTTNYFYSSTDCKVWTNNAMPSEISTYADIAVGNGSFIITSDYASNVYKGTTEVSYEYSLLPLSYNKAEVDTAIAGVDLTGYVQNTATGTDALTLLGTAANSTKALNIGVGSQATNVCTTVVGNAARASSGGATAIGCNARATAYCATAVGGSNAADASYASSTDAIALGHYARATADSAIQIGYGENNTAHTLAIGLSHNDTYTLLKSDGTIPGERMSLQGTTAPDTTTVGSIGQFYVDTTTSTGYMCVGIDTTTPSYTWKQITYSPVGTEYILEAGNWNTENNSIEISIPGLTIGTPMWIAPTVSEDNSNELNYTTHGIRLKAQQADSIILSCTIIPTENISITIIR